MLDLEEGNLMNLCPFSHAMIDAQELYTLSSLRNVFNKIAHASIMHLHASRCGCLLKGSMRGPDCGVPEPFGAHFQAVYWRTHSMDKLFELMVMSLKYQMLTVEEPKDILEVTEKHLAVAETMVSDHESKNAIAKAHDRLNEEFSGNSTASFRSIRRVRFSPHFRFVVFVSSFPFCPFEHFPFCLSRLDLSCCWSQDLLNMILGRQVKVSLLLQDDLQREDTWLRLPPAMRSKATGARVGSFTNLSARNDKSAKVDFVDIAAAREAGSSFPGHPVPLGGNLYGANRPQPKKAQRESLPARNFDEEKRAEEAEVQAAKASSEQEGAKQEEEFPSRHHSRKGNEAAMLAALVGRSENNAEDNKAIRLNLGFDDPGVSQPEKHASEMTHVGSQRENSIPDVANEFESIDINESGKADGQGGGDLLDLMDSAN